MKKNLKRVLVTFLIAVISYCSLTTEVKAVPQTIKLGGTTAVPGYVAGRYFTTKTTSDGKYVYCLNFHKDVARNTTAKLVGELDAGVAYIMQNGYPHKSFTGEKLKDYYITQTALWWYLDDTTGSSNLTNSFRTTGSDPNNLRPHIKSLVKKAKEAKSKGYAKTSISAKVSNKTMSISSDGKYYVSEDITVSSSNISEYKVSVSNAPEGTITTDKDGNAKTSFKSGETFKVKVPASAVKDSELEVKVTISGTGKVYKAYEYQPENKNQQNVTPSVITPVEENVNTSITLTTSKSTKVTIVKVDKTTGNPLAGAEMVLKDSDGNEITSWTSTTQGHVIENLPNGTYTLEETKAPEGYELNKEAVTITVDDNNKDQRIEFYNEAKERVVNISKIDQSTGQLLAGAVIVVKDANGNEIERFTSTNEPHVITGLEDGTYTVEEEEAPAGYQKTDEVISFTMDADNTSHQITIENYPEVSVPNTNAASSIALVILGLGIIGGGIKFVQKNAKKSRV